MSDEDNNTPTGEEPITDGSSEALEEAQAADADMGAAMGMNLDEVAGDMLGEEFSESPKDVEAIYDIPVQISAVLGRSTMKVSQLLKLGRGAVVELDRKVGEAIDIYVNNRLVARGEVVVNEDRLGVTMTEIVKSDRNRS